MRYSQLTDVERYKLSRFRRAGLSCRAIAEELGRSPSTITREIKRNSTVDHRKPNPSYVPSKAQEHANGRRRRSRQGPQHTPEQYARVEALLKQEQWSPVQISGTFDLLGEFAISHQTIYRHVRRNWKAGGRLWQHLRQRYKRRKRHYGWDKRGRLPGKRMIEERSIEVETRQEFGHWEIDTVAGPWWDKAGIVTLVERASGYTLIGKIRNRTVKQLNARVLQLIQRSGLPFLTITSDNGTEFHGYKQIEQATGVTFYFARPHHPWQRGTNENTNGLIRQYLPKGTNMNSLTQARCDAIALLLNTRPRKRYGFRAPQQRVQEFSGVLHLSC